MSLPMSVSGAEGGACAYSARGEGFRVAVGWEASIDDPASPLAVPQMAAVLEALLVGSVRDPDALEPEREFAMYREVVLDLLRRLDELRSCHCAG